MAADEELSALIGRIYDAALDLELWPTVLDEIAVDFNAICCHLFDADLNADEIHFAALNKRFTYERANQYHTYYRHLDKRLTELTRGPLGRAFADWELLSPETFQKSEFYNDFYVPHGLRWAIVGFPDKEGRDSIGFCIAGPPKGEPFSKAAIARAQLLFPHIRRATRMMRRTRDLESFALAGANALDIMPAGILIVTATARPLFMNQVARRMTSERNGLRISAGRLCASLANETNALQRAIGSAAKFGESAELDLGGAIAISRPSLGRSLEVLVVPIARHRLAFDLLGHDRLALVVVGDPEATPMLREETTARLHDLTAAEARVAVRLAQGQSLKEIAKSTNRSEHTVRWTLKNVFAKTDTHSQSELIRLLLSEQYPLSMKFDRKERLLRS